MKKNVYVVYDVVAKQVASTMILADNDEIIIRDLSDSKLPDVMEKHPEDFDLVRVGTLDTELCVTTSSKELVCHLGAVKNGKE